MNVRNWTFPLSFFYLIITLVAGFQLGCCLLFRWKLMSFHFGQVLLCFIWGLIRTIFFMFFVYWDTHLMVELILFWLPINLQFAAFLLLGVFYASIMFKSSWSARVRRICLIIYGIVNMTLLALFIASVVVGTKELSLQTLNKPRHSLYFQDARLIGNAVMFMLLVTVLCILGIKVSLLLRRSSTSIPQAAGLGVTKIMVVTILTFIIFMSRSIYDILGVKYSKISQIDASRWSVTNNVKQQLIAAGLYILWEIIPTTLILLLFWRIPRAADIAALKNKHKTKPYSLINNASINNAPPGRLITDSMIYAQPGVFKDPNRYNSEAEEEDNEEDEGVASSVEEWGSLVGGPYKPYAVDMNTTN
mmetsp:Transcript_28214/g.31339  ORF Transcript_28214/g.31339 Transcript_28214/m.31339 type:complete len:361 (-) Transcript_28214:92-1174(-)